MRKSAQGKYLISGIVCANILFVFLLIYKQSCISRATYHQQELEHQLQLLQRKKQEINQQFFLLKRPDSIKEYAVATLGMRPVTVHQCKRVSYAG